MTRTALNLYIWPMFFFVTLVGLAILPLLLFVNLTILGKPKAQYVRHVIRIYGWMLVRVVPFMAPVEIEDHSGGIDQTVIFVANHCSSIDPYLFGMLPYESAFITSWPFRIPIFSKIMPMAEYIYSGDGWDRIFEQSKQLLGKGCSIIVWPEGHRSKDGQVKRFKKGAFQIATLTGRPIVPVCIVGSGELLAPGKRLLSPSRVKMTILPPIPTENWGSSNETVILVRDKARKAIENEFMKYTSCGRKINHSDIKVANHQWKQS